MTQETVAWSQIRSVGEKNEINILDLKPDFKSESLYWIIVPLFLRH